MTTAKVSDPAPNGSVTVTFSSYSATCIPSVSYRLDGGATVPLGKNPGSIMISKVGTTKVEYWAVDLSENVETTKTVYVRVLSDEPSLSLSATPLQVMYPAIVTLTATASKADTTVAHFQVQYESDPKWYDIATVESATGKFVLLQIPPKRAYYRVRVGTLEATPKAVSLAVTANMSRPVATTTKVKVGQTVTFRGRIRPKHPAVDPPAADTSYKVRFWKYNSVLRRWIETTSAPWKIERVLDNDTSQWSYKRTFKATQTGAWKVAFYHSCPRHRDAAGRGTTSPPLQFSVTR